MSTIAILLCLLAGGAGPTERFDVAVPMRDGKSLSADVYLPPGPGRAPAVLVQTPYDKRRFRDVLTGGRGGDGETGRGAMSDLRVLVDRARFAYVVTDWRGFFGSRGAMKGVRRRDLGADGYDTVEWIAARPWSNGRVGTWGGSALGKAQLDTAAEGPPHLVCAVPLIAAMGQRYEFYYQDGVFREAHNRTLDLLGFGVTKIVRAAPDPDRPVWRIAKRRTYRPEAIRVPCLMITGWWDHFPGEIVTTFEDVVAKGGPAARAHSKLLIGPWDHVSVGLAKQGDRAFPGAALESGRSAKAFLDHFLLGAENGWPKTPRVRYWRVNEEGWRACESFAAIPRGETVLRLGPGGRLGPAPGRGTVSFVSDPRKPTPTLGGANLPPLRHGPVAQDRLDERKDVLAWSTGPLETPIRVNGAVTLALDVTADRVSTDLHARLCDVRGGKAWLLADTAVRLTGLEPGERRRATLRFPITAARVADLRIYLSGTNWPRYERNPGTGADRWDAKTALPVEITVHLAGAELRIPVEKAEQAD